MNLPKVVTPDEWFAAREELQAKEAELTEARESLTAERRRQPVTEITEDYVFEGPGKRMSLLDLFEGRPQLVVYHFAFAPDVPGWPDAGCEGCSTFVDQIGHPAHFNARNTTIALVSRARFDQIEPYRERMGWELPWYSSAESEFNGDFGVTSDEGESPGVSVFVRDGDRVFRSWFSADPDTICQLGSVWTYLDLTPLGQQSEIHYRRHDEYDGRHE